MREVGGPGAPSRVAELGQNDEMFRDTTVMSRRQAAWKCSQQARSKSSFGSLSWYTGRVTVVSPNLQEIGRALAYRDNNDMWL